MSKIICKNCKSALDNEEEKCPNCGNELPHIYLYKNSDDFLKREIPRVIEDRISAGLDEMVSGLACVIINVEPEKQQGAVNEMLRYTGLDCDTCFENDDSRTCVLKTKGSADLLIQSRLTANNPFSFFNTFPKSKHLVNTRLETFVFNVTDLKTFVAIQKSRGFNFLTENINEMENYLFIQTPPQKATGTSYGFIQWTGEKGNYLSKKDTVIQMDVQKPDKAYLQNIKALDHTALRVRAKDRDTAIIQFMELTNYNFEFAIYVNPQNSITNVARLSDATFAMVFTSGVSPYIDDKTSGPTEKFIHNYGTRVHHIAFHTEHIDETFEALKEDKMEFLLELVGSPEEGLKQTFTIQSPHTLLVNEYIHRFGDFDGFFTKSNVTRLTEATEKQ